MNSRLRLRKISPSFTFFSFFFFFFFSFTTVYCTDNKHGYSMPIKRTIWIQRDGITTSPSNFDSPRSRILHEEPFSTFLRFILAASFQRRTPAIHVTGHVNRVRKDNRRFEMILCRSHERFGFKSRAISTVTLVLFLLRLPSPRTITRSCYANRGRRWISRRRFHGSFV